MLNEDMILYYYQRKCGTKPDLSKTLFKCLPKLFILRQLSLTKSEFEEDISDIF